MTQPTIYRIETEHLVLRCWDPKDASLMDKAVKMSLQHLKPWMPWAHEEPRGFEDRVELLRGFRGKFDLGETFIFGVFNPEETEVWGGTGLHPRADGQVQEIGYWIRVDQVRKGFATELSAALVKAAFALYEVRRVEIRCDPENAASAAVPKKLGFINEGTLRHADEFLGKPRDTQVWGLTAEGYRAGELPRVAIRAYDAIGNLVME